MEPLARLKLLSQEMQHEADGQHECHPVINGREFADLPIAEVSIPGGGKMKVLKSMLTSACERNCNYCFFRAGRNLRRQSFQPEELAKSYVQIYRAGAVEGLFLSSGILKGGVTTQDKLLDTADILRDKLKYKGYLHLKIMPGSERDQVRRAMELGSRVSANLEAPNQGRLPSLAPMKQFGAELLDPLKWAQEIRKNEEPRRAWNGRWASTITQFVVGPSGETDLELLSTSEYLYGQLGLARAYYAAFDPVPDTPLDHLPPESPVRQQRLYQSSFLLRDYPFSLEDMPFTQDGNLPLDIDPKTAWAETNLLHHPIDLNTASREQLLMVPGVGPKGAMAIIRGRRRHRLTSLKDVQKLGVITTRMKPYVLLDGRRPSYQMELFASPRTATAQQSG